MAETAADNSFHAFAQLARIGVGTTGGADELLRASGSLALAAFDLRAASLYRLHPGGEVVAVVSCGEDTLDPLGERVLSLDQRPLFRRAHDEHSAVRDESGAPIAVAPLWGAETCLGFLAGEGGEIDDRRLAQLGSFAEVLGAFLEQWVGRERLHRLDDLKSHFIALASHELRAPVAVIHGIGVTLNERGEALDADVVGQLHRVLNEQTEHLAQLLDQLLDLSRLEASAIKLERQQISVRERVEWIVRGVAREHAEAIEVAVPEALATVADPAAFDRIVANLVTNAVRYGEPPIRIAAEQRDTHFRLRVEDRGEGVPSEFVPRLFERFTRNDGARKAIGSGLGLAIAQSYANAHGGELLYEPAEPRGACFELVLPRPHAASS